MNAVVTNDLTKKFENKVALHAVNLELPEGKILGVIGPAHSGKSTLVKILCGLISSSMGSASVFEYSCGDRSGQLHTACSVASNQTKLYMKLSALDNVLFFGKISGLSGAVVREHASLLLHKLNIWEYRDLLTEKLDMAVYRKLCVAVALITTPRLLLLDEISAGLDAATVSEIYDFVLEAVKAEQLSVLITSSTTEFMEFCDLFAILDNGKIAAKGSYSVIQKNAAIKCTAVIRTADGTLTLPLDGFQKNDLGCFEKRIDAEEDMIGIIERAVYLGNKLLEAKVMKPTLEEIYESFIAQSE